MSNGILFTFIRMRLKSVVLISAICVGGMAMSVISSLPKSEPRLIEGVVTSKGTKQGYDSGGDKLVIETDTGRTATISIFDQRGIRVNDRVLLSTYDRYLFGPRYQFVKIIR